MNRKQPLIWVSYFFMFFLIQVILEAQEPVILDSKMKPGISNDMRIEKLKVRWKKAALKNCPGVPCVTKPPAPSFTYGTSTVSDIDGNSYQPVLIGTKCWLKENLKVGKYNDGTNIPLDATGGPAGNVAVESWSGLSSGAKTVYAHNSTYLNDLCYFFWSANESEVRAPLNRAWNRLMYNYTGSVGRTNTSYNDKSVGASLRCLKD